MRIGKELHSNILNLTVLSLVRINRESLYKEPKVSVLQANAQLAQQDKCWTLIQRSRGSIPTGDNILFCIFLFSCSKASNANIAIIVNVVCLWKKLETPCFHLAPNTYSDAK